MSNYVGTKGVKYYCASECTCELCGRTGGGSPGKQGTEGVLKAGQEREGCGSLK